MGQKKLQRFNEVKTFSNVLEYPTDIRGNWKEFFRNDNSITLELACGKGEYTVGLARLYENRNFIGVDLKGNRLWVGAKNALKGDLKNVGFLRTQIEKIDEYFKPGEVSEIWITFPDPQLRVSKAKKRLTHPRFLRLYQNFLGRDGIINLKTDSPDLYNFTKTVLHLFECEILEDIEDVYAEENISEELRIKTYYESLDIAKSQRIHYLRFKLNADLPVEKDEILKEIM
jgi:tRNA (guanine-N7-)-methyltransferase